MSLILDALSRAERDKRAAEGVPDLLAPVETPQPRRAPAPQVVAAVVMVALLGALLWWALGRDDRSAPAQSLIDAATPVPAKADATSAAQPDEGSAEAAGAGGAIAPRPPAPAADAGRAGDDAAIAALYSEAPPAEAIAAPAPGGAMQVPRAASEPRPAAAEVPAEAARLAQADVQRNSSAEESPLDLDELLREARRVRDSEGLSEHPVPLLSELSQQYRDRVPTVMYLRHDYNSAGASTVLLNGAELREGQREGGLQVVEILVDSVVLRFDGRDFRLRALNSWINL